MESYMQTPWTTVDSSATVLDLDPPIDLPPALIEPPLALPLLTQEVEPVPDTATLPPKKGALSIKKVQSLAVAILYVAPMTLLGGYAAYALPSSVAAPMATALWIGGLIGATALSAFFSHTERFYRRVAKSLVEKAYATVAKDRDEKTVEEIQSLQGQVRHLNEANTEKELQVVDLKQAKAHLESKMASLMQQIEVLQAQQHDKQAHTHALLEEYRNLLGAKEQERKEQEEHAKLLEQQVADLKYEVKTLLEVARMEL